MTGARNLCQITRFVDLSGLLSYALLKYKEHLGQVIKTGL